MCFAHSISLSGNASALMRSTKTTVRQQTMLNLARLLRLRLREGKSIHRQGQRHVIRKKVSSMGRAEDRASVKSDRTFAVTRGVRFTGSQSLAFALLYGRSLTRQSARDSAATITAEIPIR